MGVGGGEFRLPALLRLYGDKPKTASAVNLVVGLFTVVLSLVRRWGLHQWTGDEIAFMLALSLASALGSVAGAKYADRLPSRAIKYIIYAYLLIVSGWMSLESVSRTEHIIFALKGSQRLLWGAAAGTAVAFVSAVLGVAGGEMRIPLLLYFFALPIKEAGTISLAASVTTVAAGARTYRSLGHLPKEAMIKALVLGVASMAGVLIGTSWLPRVDKHFLKGVLGVVLFLAALFLIWSEAFNNKSRHRQRKTTLNPE